MVDERARADPGLQRLHLQLPAAARRAAGPRLPVLLHLGHRGDHQGVPPLGRRLRAALPRHVRVRDRRARHRHRDAGPRPARHQAAVPGRDARAAALRVHPARAARGRRRRHVDRQGRAAALHDVPLGGAGAAHDRRRGAQAAAGHGPRDQARRYEHRDTSTGRPSFTRDPGVTTREEWARRGRASRCAPRSSGGWSPTCRSACCSPAGSTPASSWRCWPSRGSAA